LVHRAVRVLETVAEAGDRGIGLTELARAAEMSKATCFRIVTGLRECQWVMLDAESKHYRLGLGLLAVAGRLASASGIHKAVLGTLRQLAADAGETAGIDMLAGDEILVLEEVQGPNLIGQVPRPLPRRLPAYCTSTGKVFLAHMAAERVFATYADKYLKRGPAAADTLQQFLTRLPAVRKDGYAVAFDEFEHGAAAIAAPIFNSAGEVEYAVWVGGPTYRLTKRQIVKLAPLAIRAATELAVLFATDGRAVSPLVRGTEFGGTAAAVALAAASIAAAQDVVG
jgi:IclR family acetate operon transcriptional repressor